MTAYIIRENDTEQLKTEKLMEWVRKKNNISSRITKSFNRELYNQVVGTKALFLYLLLYKYKEGVVLRFEP